MKTKLIGLSLLLVITFLACITWETVAMAADELLPLGYEGPCNTFYGAGAGAAGAAGDCNTLIGGYAGTATTGGSNTFIGYYSGWSNVGGSLNTYLGYASGRNATGTANVFLGYQAGFSEAGSNKLYIANTYTGSPLIYGEFDNSIVKINGTLLVASDARLKQGIEPLHASLGKVLQLRGVSYQWERQKNRGRGFSADREIGLIAQEVEKVLPELVHTDGTGYKSIAYDKLVPVLIEAVKEQQKGFEKALSEKDSRIERLEQALASMEKRLAAVEQPARTIASK